MKEKLSKLGRMLLSEEDIRAVYKVVERFYKPYEAELKEAEKRVFSDYYLR